MNNNMIRKIVTLIIIMVFIIIFTWFVFSVLKYQIESQEYNIKQAQINRDLQRCNELRNGGFFSSVGQPVGSTTPNPDPEQGYQRCLEQARNP